MVAKKKLRWQMNLNLLQQYGICCILTIAYNVITCCRRPLFGLQFCHVLSRSVGQGLCNNYSGNTDLPVGLDEQLEIWKMRTLSA